jgi:hypothetical protein
VDLVRSSLNPVGGMDAGLGPGGFGAPPQQQHSDVGFDPLKAFNVVRCPPCMLLRCNAVQHNQR